MYYYVKNVRSSPSACGDGEGSGRRVKRREEEMAALAARFTKLAKRHNAKVKAKMMARRMITPPVAKAVHVGSKAKATSMIWGETQPGPVGESENEADDEAEFKAEDAQEYLKSREKLKKQQQGSTMRPWVDQGFGGGGSGSQSPPREFLNMLGGEGTWAPPAGGAHGLSSVLAATPPDPRIPDRSSGTGGAGSSSSPVSPQGVSPSMYQPQVEQLTAMGFNEEQARQALAVTGGDVEAAADWLLS